MDHLTPAHRRARHEHTCPTCGKYLRNAKYAGEYAYVFDRQGQPQRVAVYLECSCKTLIEASINLIDDTGFTDVMDTLERLPITAQKIKQHIQSEYGGQS